MHGHGVLENPFPQTLLQSSEALAEPEGWITQIVSLNTLFSLPALVLVSPESYQSVLLIEK